jgi:hypothetical protein
MVELPTDIVKHYVRTRGVTKGLKQWLKRAYLRKTTDHRGMNIFNSEWDVLVILDACRPDLLASVSEEYNWINGIKTVDSVGTATLHWMEQTFPNVNETTLKNTVYVCGNPFSGHLLDDNQFTSLEEVWKWGWSDEEGTVPPRPVTDAAISTARERSLDRLLVHYMQPHAPFLGSEHSPTLSLENFNGSGSRPLDDWELIEMGERTESEVWEDYKENLRRALDDVEILRDNVDAKKMIITADHGNAVGEYGLYGHPGGVSVPALYEVPWCETEATDSQTHEPDPILTDSIEQDREGQLRALGYV